jgi:trigger factor
VKVIVEKRDDINYTLSGSVAHGVIDAKVEMLKEEASNKEKGSDQSSSDAVDTVLDSMNVDKFQREAEGAILQEFIEAGLKEASVAIDDILGQPSFRKYEKQEEGIYLEIDIATAPVIDTSISFEDIIPTYTKPTASLDEVEQQLKEMAVQQAPFTPIETPRAVVDGDVVQIDFKGFIDGKPFEGGSAEKFNLKVGSNSFIPGFESQLVGMEYDQTRQVVVTFPSDYQAQDLAGKESTFEVTLHEIQEQHPMAIDDALAQRILNDPNASLETLKQKLSDKITSQELSNLYNEELKPQLIKGLVAKFSFTLPNNVIEQEIDAKINERAQRMSKAEHDLFKNNKEKFMELRDEVRPEAQEAIKSALIVEAIAKEKGMMADEQEVLSALYYQAMMTGKDATELVEYYKKNNLMTSAIMGLTEDKLFGHILGFDR